MATDAGSRMHVLDWVEQPRDAFLGSLNALLCATGATVGPIDHWRPLGRHDPGELRLTRPDDPLVPSDLACHLRSWWLAVDHPGANDPNWDFAGSTTFPENRRGLVLVEAKAHVAELTHAASGKAPGNAAKLDDAQREALADIVERGPIPAIHGVVRWRLADLAQWIREEFGISLSETTVGRELKALGYRKISARPRIMPRTSWPSKILRAMSQFELKSLNLTNFTRDFVSVAIRLTPRG